MLVGGLAAFVSLFSDTQYEGHGYVRPDASEQLAAGWLAVEHFLALLKDTHVRQ